MKLVFLGTRGEIEARSRLHRMHSSLEIGYRGSRLTIDAGLDWLERVAGWRTAAIVLTHAHPDHAWGLKRGAPCPVYATAECWQSVRALPIAERRVIEPRVPFDIGAIRLEAFAVEHSIRAPAVGYRISAGRVSVFYAPDLVYIHERGAALAGALRLGDRDGAGTRCASSPARARRAARRRCRARIRWTDRRATVITRTRRMPWLCQSRRRHSKTRRRSRPAIRVTVRTSRRN